jgi:cytochrome c-type biogenesis protein CcmH
MVALILAAGFYAGCSKGADPGKPAGVPPLAVAAAPTAAPTAAPSAPQAASQLPVPAAAASQALAGALGLRGADEGEGEAIPDTPDEAHTVSGVVVLPAANRARVARGDVMFLAARRVGGPPGPASMLAVQRLVAADFPMPFSISGRDAMIPGVPFDGRVSIIVRVDKDGDAMTRRKGDVFGQASNVAVGSQKVVIALDKVQAEDETLGAAGPPVGVLPPGHP